MISGEEIAADSESAKTFASNRRYELSLWLAWLWLVNWPLPEALLFQGPHLAGCCAFVAFTLMLESLATAYR